MQDKSEVIKMIKISCDRCGNIEIKYYELKIIFKTDDDEYDIYKPIHLCRRCKETLEKEFIGMELVNKILKKGEWNGK